MKWMTTNPHAQWREKSIRPHASTATPSPDLAVTAEQFQTIDGFGGCFNELGWIALNEVGEAERNEVLHRLFAADECAFTLCRLPVGASDYAAEWYSHNETPGDYAMQHFSIDRDYHFLLPYIKKALAIQPQLTLFASPWSPPTWMKFPRAYNYGTLIRTPENLRAYALYFVRFVQAYAETGIKIHQIHVQNEPVADQKFPSCVWTGEELRDFIRDYLAPAFVEFGLDCEIWLGTLNTDDYDGYPNTVLSDPNAAAAIAGVGFQWAGKGAVQRTHQAWPEKRLMQTENECGDGKNTWEYARYVFNLIRHYLVNGTNSYVYWNMVLAPGGLSTWGWQQNAMVTVSDNGVVYNPEYYVMRHFSHFIRPGAVLRGVRGPCAANALAFENPDHSLVVQLCNPFSQERRLTVELDGTRFSASLAPFSFHTFFQEQED